MSLLQFTASYLGRHGLIRQVFARSRDYVIPDDVDFICADVFTHRIMLSSKAKLSDVTASDIISEILRNVNAPGVSSR